MKKALSLIAAVTLALTMTACDGGDTTTVEDDATMTTTVENTQDENVQAADTEAEQAEAEQAEDRAAGYESWLKEQFGVESFTEVLMNDPSLWAGYINGFEANRDRMHVRLQVDRNDPADEALGEQAAAAIASLIRTGNPDPRVSGVDWVVVDDGAGVVIAQESV
ncbi:hypothetical protein G6027_10300 [Dietzia sp. SLG310A2-38A2]|uniref:hypothetical protein n=1 Tax=Dietzia sp. SLG310A2-38A2 TaxID=1630643 RepID=UPI0015F81A58|nr:hypothetical protein [Dietzia sp. SLG310A2-38A2]MBB1031271.1 hypothetical protein [Dietzia sp. SLG310A2-38A2]